MRGFAHVTFATVEARDKAMALDNAQVGNKGRYLKIEAAKTPTPVVSVSAAEVEGKRRLFAKNLPYDATEAELGELFKSCGKIVEIRVPTSVVR